MNWKSFDFLDKVALVGVVFITLVVFSIVSVNNSSSESDESPRVPVLEGFEEYQEQLDWFKERHRGESFCELEPKSEIMQNTKGSWRQVVQAQPCFTISEDLGNRQFSQQELESASNWYMDFLLAEVFDGTLLNDPESFLIWLETEAPDYFSEEVLAMVAADPDGEFEVDGSIVDADEMVAVWGKTDSNFYAFTNDGGPRILAIEGSLGADFISLEHNQIDLTGRFSIYYRVDKSIYVDTLIEKEDWTLVALKEQHPELFDASPLAVRIVASVGHTLEQAEGSDWVVTKWRDPSYTFRVGKITHG